MKNLKSLSALLLLSGVLAFSACKKEVLQQEAPVAMFKKGVSQPVQITATGQSIGNINSGAFAASGAFSTNGNWEEVYSYNGNKYHGKVEFTDANGSFEMHTSGNIVFSNATTASGTGIWSIKKATGIYAGMDGSGTLTINLSNLNGIDGDVSEVLIGDVIL